MLPGDFNIATSTLFGGQYCGIHIDNQGWAAADANFDELTHIRSMSDMKADMIFKTVSASSASSAVMNKYTAFIIYNKCQKKLVILSYYV